MSRSRQAVQPSTPDTTEASPQSPTAFEPVAAELASRQNADADSNIEWNKQRWGQPAGWSAHDSYGYQWSNRSYTHTAGSVAEFVDRTIRPLTGGRYDLDILEISPGAGRITVELIRYASKLALVDLNAAPIQICRERLGYYPNEIEFVVNDGRSLAAFTGQFFDLIVSYDSLVHVHPDVVRGYLDQSIELLKPGGIVWLDHSGKGANAKSRRSDVTAEMVQGWVEQSDAELVSQDFRNDWDCITIARKQVAPSTSQASS